MELFVCSLLIVDVFLQTIGFGTLYLKSWTNVFDSFMVVLYLVLTLASLNSEQQTRVRLSGILKVCRVIVLVRYLVIVKLRAERRLKFNFELGSNEEDAAAEFQTVQEKVINKLGNILFRLDKHDSAVKDLEYCLKRIASGNLYDGVDMFDDSDDISHSSSDDSSDSDKSENDDVINPELVRQARENAALNRGEGEGAVNTKLLGTKAGSVKTQARDTLKIEKTSSKDLKRRHTIAVGLGGNSKKQQLKAWYDQFSVNKDKKKK